MLSECKCWEALPVPMNRWCLCDCGHPARVLTYSLTAPHPHPQQRCCADLGVHHQGESAFCKPKGISCWQVIKLSGFVSWWL